MHKHPENRTDDKSKLARTSLVAHFARVPDPRINRRREHDLIDILVIAVCTLLCAGETFNDMEDFGKAKYEWFRSFLNLRNGIPCAGTAPALRHHDLVAGFLKIHNRDRNLPVAGTEGELKKFQR